MFSPYVNDYVCLTQVTQNNPKTFFNVLNYLLCNPLVSCEDILLIAENKILKRVTKIFSQHEMNKGAGE